MATYAAKLASIEAAIAAIEAGGQETRYDNRSVRMGDLAALYAERKRLEIAAAREASGRRGIGVRYGVVG